MNEPTQPATPSQSDASQPQPGQRGARYMWEMEQARRRAVRDLVEQRIQEAREEGKFDNLAGAGQPLRLDDDVWSGDKSLAYHLLKSNNAAPPEVERGQEIDRDLQRADEPLRLLRFRRDALLARSTASASDRRAYNTLRAATERAHAEALRAINSNILSLNIIAPAALHRRLLDIDGRMAKFREEFPPLAER